jgi:hypothetical protein
MSLPNPLVAGETALAHFGMLAESQLGHFAIGKEQFRSLRTLNRLPDLNKNQGNFCLEVWNYDPGVIVKPGQDIIDKLSLYLSMAPAQDERTEAALEEMLSKVSW